jgi:negative regulator of genetic competence, sporulation and motility
MNVIVQSNDIIQNNEIVHITIHEHSKIDLAEQDMAIAMLTQMLDSQYKDAELTVVRNKYNVVTNVSIQFADIEDAIHFKLTYM